MRTFVAIDLTSEIRGRLAELIECLRPTVAGVRWVDPAGMHLTLQFIGEISEEKSRSVERALAAVRVHNSIPIQLRELGFFPTVRHPRVFWVGVEAPPGLAQLAEQIENALSDLGIAREAREFKPHLTLGRFRSEEGLDGLRLAIATLKTTEFGRMEAREFFLFQSILGPRGAQYRKLKQFDFMGAR